MLRMTNREKITAVLEGKHPDRIPLTIYGDFIDGDPSWDKLFKLGLCRTQRVQVVRETIENVEKIIKNENQGKYNAEYLTMRTPIGEVTQVSFDGWIQEYFLKTPEDYRVMKYIVQNTRLEFEPESYHYWDNKLVDYGIPIIKANRSPIQTILLDYAGLENLSYHLAEDFPEIHELIEVLMEQLLNYCRIVANGPGRYVQLRENLTSDQLGPDRYKKYHMPVYEKIIPILHAGGKKVFTHYDGKIACIAKLIAQTQFDGIESITSPPEGDMTYSEARAALPDKIFWANINVSNYTLPPKELREKVIDLMKQASPDGRNLAFEISEDLTSNWREALPMVLETLDETKYWL